MKNYPLHSKTATMIDGARAAAPRRAAAAGAAARGDLLRAALLVVASFLATWLLRAIYLGRAYDIFVDEANYLSVSESVSRTLRMATFEGPFYLHPPAFFYLEAAFLSISQPAGNIVQQIYAGRFLNTILGGLSAAVLLLLGRRLAGWSAGIAAAGIFALEPFIVRMNSRNFIETFATLAILIGYYCLLGGRPNDRRGGRASLEAPRAAAARDSRRDPYQTRQLPALDPAGSVVTIGPAAARPQRPDPYQTRRLSVDATVRPPAGADRLGVTWPRAIGAGCAFGLALLAKETTLLLTLLPLAICFFLGWSIARRAAVAIGALACLIYALYPLGVALSGEWHEFAWQKTAGIRRFAGLQINTGFNHQPTGGRAASFAQAILANLDQFATTYALIGAGVLAVLVLLRLGGAANRLLAAWTGSAYLQQGYSMKFGTNEEHFFYYLVIPALLASVVAAAALLRSPRLPSAGRRAARVAIALLGVAFVAWAGYVWVERRFTPDNGNERLLAYMEQNVPAGSCVDAATATSDWLLHGYGYRLGRWGTAEEVRANGAEYVVVGTRLIEQGYDLATPELYQWLRQHAQPIFTFEGPTNGALILYQVVERPLAPCGAAGTEAGYGS